VKGEKLQIKSSIGRGQKGTSCSDGGLSIKKWNKTVKRKPDLVLVLTAAFALGVVLTLLLPLAANHSVADPASALQAGVIIPE